MSLGTHLSRVLGTSSVVAAACTLSSSALAQPAGAPAATGTPPADISGAVAAPTELKAPEKAAPPTDATNVAISAGGQMATGNSKLYAGTAQGKLDLRRGNDAFGAALVGNFAETFTTPTATAGQPAPAGSWQKSTENLQGKLRYDRYFSPVFGAFLQTTGTHDAFQAITFRLNIDPGVKLIVLDAEATKLWGELGYDFEFDDNYVDGSGIEQAGAGGPQLDSNGLPYVIQGTDTIHSSRLFAGFRHQFNKEVLLTAGLEYLQGMGGSGGGTPAVPSGYTADKVDLVGITLTSSRVNFDALLAAHVGGGFSLGVGTTVKYNSAPLAGKQDVDTTATFSVIYAFSSPGPKEEKKCPCPAEPPPGENPPPPPPPPPPPLAPPAAPAAPPAGYVPAPTPVPAPAPAPSSTPSRAPAPGPLG